MGPHPEETPQRKTAFGFALGSFGWTASLPFQQISVQGVSFPVLCCLHLTRSHATFVSPLSEMFTGHHLSFPSLLSFPPSHGQSLSFCVQRSLPLLSLIHFLKDVIYTAYFSMFWLHFSRGFPLLRVLWLLCLLLRLQAPPDNCHLSYILCTCGVQLTHFQLFFPFPFLFFFFVFVTTFTNASSHSLFPCYSSKIPLLSSWPPWMFVGSLGNLGPASV